METNQKKPKVVLPRVPSQLIRIALEDLEKCEINPAYIIDMGVWHSYEDKEDGKCSVCLAGFIMAQRLGVTVYEDAEPLDDYDNKAQLMAINLLRTGSIAVALKQLGRHQESMDASGDPEFERWEETMNDCSYVSSREKFKDRLWRMADFLERRGL